MMQAVHNSIYGRNCMLCDIDLVLLYDFSVTTNFIIFMPVIKTQIIWLNVLPDIYRISICTRF